MNKMIFVLSLFLLFTVACTQDKTKANDNTKSPTNHVTMSHNVHPIDVNRMKKPYTADITGLVEVYDDGSSAVVQNWTSRSRVTLTVTPDSEVNVKPYKGKVIKVKGVITKSSMWSGTIKIIEIENTQTK